MRFLDRYGFQVNVKAYWPLVLMINIDLFYQRNNIKFPFCDVNTWGRAITYI